MSHELRPSARKFQTALIARGFQCEVVELPDATRTAPQAAQAIGCAVAQIAKSLVFKGRRTDKAILVIASGANRVDEAKLGELVAEPVEKANAHFARERTGFVIGGIAPTCHTESIATFIDEDLLQHAEIWAAAGTPHALFKLTPSHLRKMTGGQVAAIK
ncbi:MAG: YbaK/EbsC family protein [Gammaproteobacteria bacterium]|nr:YbaK/EbsC family protein [Gammaproteobacteria bacterium]